MDHVDNLVPLEIDNDRPISASLNPLQSSFPTIRSCFFEEAA
jgi:hypothetical protein